MEYIRKARKEDAEIICQIANGNALKNIKKLNKNNTKNGFLVSQFSLEDYENYIANYEHIYVLSDNKKIRAFLLAYNRNELDNNLIVNKKIIQNTQNDFAVIKQICVAKDAYRKGYATKLYQYFIDIIKKDIYLSVVLEPYNGASVAFHNKLGFDQVFDVVAEDGMIRGVFYKPVDDSDIIIDQEIILEQYEVAVDLYKHEDELNWSKMNHLFYVTGGFILLFSFIFGTFEGLHLYLSLMIVSFVGMLVSYMFNVAIKSGIMYLQRRKDTVIDIERILIAKKGVKVVSAEFSHNYRIFKKSPTTTIMQIIPKLLILLWFIVFMVSIILSIMI